MALGPGSIAFTGFNADGNDDFAIVALGAIAAGTVITFRDDEWNGTAWADSNEGTMTWTVTTEIAAGTIVTFNNQSGARTVSTGTLAGESLAFSATSETLYAYVDGPTPTFLTAIANDSFSAANGSLANTGLTIGSTAIQFTGSIDGMVYAGPRSGQGDFANYLSQIGDTANWTHVGAGGDATALLPFDATPLTVGADVTAPTLSTSTPVDESASVAVDANIVLTLSENVQKGTGDILIKLASDNSVVQTINVTLAAVTVVGNTVTVNPPSDLAPGTAYYVEIAPGAIEDLAGNDYAGISGATPLNFTTAEEADDITSISEIQGSGHVSALDGQAVTTEGVVIAVDTNGSRGFYIQDPNGDGNAATSDGIFVFTNAAPTVTVGQLVRVTGVVDEFIPNGAAPGSFSTTEIVATSAAGGVIEVLGTGPAIEATVIGGEGGLLPPSTSFADASAFYESLEGMLVTVKEAVVTGPTNDFGEIYTVIDNDADRSNGVNGSELNDRGALQIEAGAPDFGNIDVAGADFNPERLQIDDDNGVSSVVSANVSTGAQLGDVTGIVRYDFGNYEIVATQAYTVEQQSALVKETTTLQGSADRLTVASYNAENLDPNDGAARFSTIAQEILTNLKAPDIIALQEVQDNDGPGNAAGSAVTAANVTLQTLVDALNAAAPAGVQYAFIDNPFIGDDSNGGEGGGNIRTAFIYRTDRVDFVDGSLKTVAADGAVISDPAGNVDQQTNTDNPFFDSRPPLIASFEFNGQDVTIVNNHFTSKGGSGALYGSDDSPLNAGEVQRAAQAQAVNNFVDGLLATDPDAKIIVTGDLNDFEFEEPLAVMNGTASVSNYNVADTNPDTANPITATATYTPGGTQVLHDLLETLPANERYDYVFEGNAQSLDHVLVSESLQDGAQFDVVRINAEFGDQTSDHDPLVASFEIPAASQNFTLQLLHLADGEAGLLAGDTAPMLAALVDAYDDDYANTLILSGGDNFIPGPFINAGTDPSLNSLIGATAPGRPDVAIHNALGVEVSAIGNHEWDLGSNIFADSIRPAGAWTGADYALVTANLDFSADSAMRGLADQSLGGTAGNNFAGQEASSIKGKVAPWVTVTEGGEKIGILGATTQILERISSPTGTEVNGFPKNGQPGDGTSEVDDMDLLASHLQPIIDQMIASGINKIILQSHLQDLDNERALATKLHGVDIILAAGSNTRLGDADDEAVEFPGHAANFADTYPIVTQGTDGKTTLIVNTDNEYTYLGRLVVEFDENGDIILDSLQDNAAINGAHAATAQNVAEAWGVDVADLEATAFAEGTKGDKVQDITEAVEAVIAAKDGNVFGYTDVYLEGERAFVRGQETNFGNLSADANGHAARVALGEEPFVVSLKNGGGIRAQIGSVDVVTGEKIPPIANPDASKPGGAVSELDIENALRFDNKLMVFDVTPAGLLALLNHGANALNGGGFPQIGGVRFSFDPDLPAGSRVQDVALIDEDGNFLRLLIDDGVVVPGAPSTISIVTLNFTANGGDGYPAKTVGENFRFLLQDGTLTAPVDETLDFTAPAVVPTNALGEQQAFEEFMTEFHGTPETAYDEADTSIADDTRIQNLNFREDTVSDGAPIVGTDGDDDIEGTTGDDTIDAGDGDDRVWALAGNDHVVGGNGDDIIDGGEGNDKLFGNDGEDVIEGGSGNDEIDGGNGDDRIFGDDGDDIILAGNGDDNVKGNAGNDTFVVLDHTADGADKYDGGAGIDTIDFGASTHAINLTLANGTTSFASDTISNVENVFGGSGNDVITGNDQANELRGNGGNDELNGGDGDDLLDGGDGDDILVGGAGIDRFFGGSGNDKIYAGADDTVMDGGDGDDTLYLSANGAASLGGTTAIENLVVQEGSWSVAGSEAYDAIAIEDGATVTSTVTLNNDDQLTVETGGKLVSATAIVWTGGGDAVVENAGLIEASSRVFNTTAGATGSFTFNNDVGGVVRGTLSPQQRAAADAVITINNAGMMEASGRVIDFQSLVADGADVTINNLAGGTIRQTSSNTDVIRPGQNTVVNNWGTITTAPGFVGGGDLIDYQSSTGGKVNNYAGGWMEGARHAVTGDHAVTVLNEGTMIGRNGSAVNIDNDGSEADKVFITNRGTMEGRSAELADSDGDAIDVDGLVQVLNYGRIAGMGAEGYHDGEPNVSEAIAVGGGTILNYGANAVIYGYGRAIQVDNSSNSNALGKTFINNEGLIQGDGRGPEGVAAEDAARFDLRGNEAINLVGDYDDEILNQSTGRIVGGVSMGGGNDHLQSLGSFIATGGSAIDMGAGNDTVYFYTGTTVQGTVLLGTGDDLVLSTADSDLVIDGGDGNDQMYISGYLGGDDTLSGGAGDDRIYGGLGGDRIDGGADDDSLYGEAGDDLIEGGGGDDYIDGGNDDDVIFGDAGNDTIIGGLGNDTVKGNDGDDTFVITSTADGRDSYDGGDGIDTLDYSAVSTAVNLTLKDNASSTFATDTIENIENVIGGSAADKLTGNSLDNVLTGNAGDDTLKGGAGNDVLYGGEGDDTLDGGADNDQLSGGVGDDVLKGAAGDDHLDGGAGNDDLDGGAGNDTLLGGLGDDVLKGGAGNDVIQGGAGNDTLTGGAGFDQYIFDSLSDGIDTITDFKVSGASEDQIVLSASMFQNFSGDDAFDLIGSGFLRAVSSGGETTIQIDVDGGGDSFQTLALLNGNFTNGMLADHTIVVQDPIA